MDKWVILKTSVAICISAASLYIFVGCENSVVRVFLAKSLAHMTTLPKHHYLGIDIPAPRNQSQPAQASDMKYPGTVAISFDEEHHHRTCIYNDHSLYVWDIPDLKKIG